jgi:hypothetical protein
MTRLLAPNPGEVADRSTILELKIAFAEKHNSPAEHFHEELSDLNLYLGEKWSKDYEKLRQDMLKVNQKLWYAEDEIRAVRKKGDTSSLEAIEKLAGLAVIITEQNDVRSNLVRQINELFGITAQEKLYTCATTK